MRAILQRVFSASVEVDGQLISKIRAGLLILLGIGEFDDPGKVLSMAKKISELRIFSDENGKMNLSVSQTQGEILLVSQFTLYANCTRGRRPDFTHAAKPIMAKNLCDTMQKELMALGLKVKTGVFGADMKVNMQGDGPVSIILEI